MPDKGRPRLALDSPPSLLLRLRPDATHARSDGPILSLRAPASLSQGSGQWTCRPDQLQLRWRQTDEGLIPTLAIDPPGSSGPACAQTWTLQLPLEQLLLAADRQGRAETLVVDGPHQPLAGTTEPSMADRLIRELGELQQHGHAGHTAGWLLQESRLLDLLVRVLPHGAGGGNNPRRDRGWQHVIQSLRRMVAGLNQDLSLPELSAATGVSPRALQMAFRRHLGKRPLQSLRELRLARLRQFLLEVERPSQLLQTVERCGLPSNSTTARHYQDRYGEKPSQTRR